MFLSHITGFNKPFNQSKVAIIFKMGKIYDVKARDVAWQNQIHSWFLSFLEYRAVNLINCRVLPKIVSYTSYKTFITFIFLLILSNKKENTPFTWPYGVQYNLVTFLSVDIEMLTPRSSQVHREGQLLFINVFWDYRWHSLGRYLY